MKKSEPICFLDVGVKFKKIAGNEVSVGRTVTSTTIGAGLGAAAAGGLVVAGVAAAAPVVVPLAVAAGAVSFVKSLFD